MDRYQNTNEGNRSTRHSRTAKNEELYQDLGRTMKYTSFTTELPAVEIDAANKNYKTREDYQKIKEYGDFFEEELPKARKELKEFNQLYDTSENRVYDINSVLAQAKKDRTIIDEREKKRKLKNEKYNIAATMDKDELEAIKNRKKIFEEEEQEELQELIDTITSHELREELDESQEGSLLADLMATSSFDEITSSQNLPKDTESLIEETAPLKKAKTGKLTQDMDDSFYTRSLDLSDKDFEMDDELGEELKESKKMLIVKLIFLILLLVVVVVGSYFIIKSF